MADKKDEKAAADDGKAKKQKSNLVPAIVLAVGIAAAGYFLGPGKGAPASADAKAEAKKEEEKPLGPISTMEPISVNLADGHYVKVGLGVQLSAEANAEEFDAGPILRVKDLLIEEVGGDHIEEYSTPEGRDQLKESLRHQAEKVFHGEVVDFYFTDFVMQ